MKFTIIANAIPLGNEIIQNITKDQTIIALDGIADHLLVNNIIPFAIVGDFDSIRHETIQAYRKLNVLLCKIDDQNSTDLDKGVDFCKSHGATEIMIINALGGGRIDHTLMNYRALKRYHTNTCRIRIKEQTSYLEFFQDTNIMIKGEIGSAIALLSAYEANITSHGLEYEMQDYNLIFGIRESTSNSIRLPEVKINIQGSIILIYHITSEVIL